MLCIAVEIGTIPFISPNLISPNQFFRSLKIWIRRWREIIDYALILLKIKKLI